MKILLPRRFFCYGRAADGSRNGSYPSGGRFDVLVGAGRS
jgi:hypothetical protein